VVLLPTLVLVVDCDTRAGYVVLLAVPAWLLLCRVAPLALRVGPVVVAVIAGVCVGLWPPARLAEATIADVRLPLWQGALHIVGEHPVGVGPGRMATYGPPAVAQTGFYQRPVISNTTDHPHNEALHVAV